MKSGVYIIICLVSGKYYIGYSNNIRLRLNNHKHDLRTGVHDNPYLQHAFKQYGEANFSFEPLEYYPVEIMASMENWWCNMLDTHNRKRGYNIRCTGEENHKVSESTKEKLRTLRGGANNSFYGKRHSEETRRAISTAKLGKPAHNKGVTISEAQREKLKKRVFSEETRKRISDAKKGRCFSEEHKLNLSKAKLGKKLKGS